MARFDVRVVETLGPPVRGGNTTQTPTSLPPASPGGRDASAHAHARSDGLSASLARSIAERRRDTARAGEVPVQHSPVLDVVGRGGGRALDTAVRQRMERAFGHDFGDVRVHTGPDASRSAESVRARAYTVGDEIVFGTSAYSPGTGDGDRRLAHELTHVVQQRRGPVEGTPSGDGIAVSSPSDRFERAARANADRVMAQIASRQSAPHDLTMQASSAAGPGASTAAPRRSEGGGRSPSRVTVQREDTSAELLQTLATPKIGKPQAKDVQIKLVDALDALFKRESEFNLGGILIDRLESNDDLLGHATLVRLPHGLTKGRMVTVFKSVGEDRAQEVIDAGLGPLVVENTLKTMIDARQIEYLRMAGLPNDEWKILVEVHYISARPKDMSGLHKDTRNETLFVNLNYHVGDRDVVGPEYVVNPHPPEEHEAKIAGTGETKGTLPPKFIKDLKKTRTRLGEPTEIKTGVVGPFGYVAFVDEAIHHTTPHYGNRVVSGPEMAGFLEKESREFKELTRAAKEYQASWWPKSKWPFESYIDKSIVKETEIPKWQELMEMAQDPVKLYTRDDLKVKGMSDAVFERMLATVGTAQGAERRGGRAGGFEKVLVNSGAVPVDPTGRRPRLKRQMSDASFKRPAQLPPDVTRRFIRTWVRAIPAAKALEMQDLLKPEEPAVTSEQISK